jgi:hypothetical protein
MCRTIVPLSPRIVALKEIPGQLRPAPLPPRRHYEPPSRVDIVGDVSHRQLTNGGSVTMSSSFVVVSPHDLRPYKPGHRAFCKCFKRSSRI